MDLAKFSQQERETSAYYKRLQLEYARKASRLIKKSPKRIRKIHLDIISWAMNDKRAVNVFKSKLYNKRGWYLLTISYSGILHEDDQWLGATISEAWQTLVYMFCEHKTG